jgi:hypothetical protein
LCHVIGAQHKIMSIMREQIAGAKGFGFKPLDYMKEALTRPNAMAVVKATLGKLAG